MIESTQAILTLHNHFKTEFKSSLDPYAKIECLEKEIPEPAILIEAENSNYDKVSGKLVVKKNHKITMTCMVSAQDKEFIVFRSELDTFVAAVLKHLEKFESNMISLIPVRETRGEFMIDSMKISAVVIELEFK